MKNTNRRDWASPRRVPGIGDKRVFGSATEDGSDEHEGGILDEAAELGEVFGADGAVDDAVIGTETDIEPLADSDLPGGSDDGLFDDGADGEDQGLGGIDDGREAVDAIAAKV